MNTKSKPLADHSVFAFVLAVVTVIAPVIVSAEEDERSQGIVLGSDSTDGAELTKAEETERSWGVVPLPLIGYSPDTGGVFGLSAILFYGNDVDAPKNTVMLNGIVTTKGSFGGGAATTNYLRGDTYRWENSAFVHRTPGVFYGIGFDADDEEEFKADAINLSTSILRETVEDLYVGPTVLFQRTDISEYDSDGSLKERKIPGSSRVTTNAGIGGTVLWDTTGGAFWPESGYIAAIEMVVFSRVWGSTTSFGTYSGVYTSYLPFGYIRRSGAPMVLALKGKLGGSWGDTPFTELPSIGGDGVMRGIMGGRYRDNFVTVLQGEYRIPLTPRLGVTAFGATGYVASDFPLVQITGLRYAAGIGFRVALNKEQRINLRIDIAVAPSGLSPYLSLGEAF